MYNLAQPHPTPTATRSTHWSSVGGRDHPLRVACRWLCARDADSETGGNLAEGGKKTRIALLKKIQLSNLLCVCTGCCPTDVYISVVTTLVLTRCLSLTLVGTIMNGSHHNHPIPLCGLKGKCVKNNAQPSPAPLEQALTRHAHSHHLSRPARPV